MHSEHANIEEIIIKYLSSDISSDEISSLENLLEDNPENRQIFQKIKEAWMASSLYDVEINQLKTQSSWEKVRTRMTVHNSTKKVPFTRILKIAALWLLLVSIGSIVTWFMMEGRTLNRPNGTCEIQTPLGSRTHTVLPDGTEVWLNAGTTLRYPESFVKRQRDVYLTGEAFFKVKTNKKWPFIVHTTEVNIKALGTSFNVKAYPTDKTVVATLIEGVIKLENIKDTKKEFTYTLKPKEKLTYYKTQKIQTATTKAPETNATNAINPEINNVEIKENTNTILSTSWKDSRWVIDGEPIDDLAVMLERRFGVKINVQSAELSNYKFTGTIENETLEQVLKYLKLTTPVNYAVEKGYVDLTVNEALKDKYTNYLKKNPTK